MTRDYAKKRRITHNQPSRGNPRFLSIPNWAWLIVGLSLGIGIAASAVWKWSQQLEATPIPPILITENKTPEQDSTLGALEAQESKSRFDFYTLLPNLKVELPDVEAPPSTRGTGDSSSPTENSMAFIIQAGSFKTQGQAEKLKAQLALSGVESQIQNVNIPPDETWYRVYIGPFKAKEDALVVQQNLQETKIANGLILKIQV